MTDFLHVCRDSDLVGKLWLDQQKNFVFQYQSEWLSHSDSFPLSIRLPLQEQIFSDHIARPFFSNLLPEAHVRDLIAGNLGISRNNDYKLLEAIGGECAGALSLISVGANQVSKGAYEKLSIHALNAMIQKMPRRPLLAAKHGMRLSLAGAQNKLPVYLKDQSIYLPKGACSSSHIIKPQITGFEHTVENEAFCMSLAQKINLPVPPSQILSRAQIYMVKRYDRHEDEHGSLIRLHQEDFCQAMGCRDDQKYESEGGPSLKDCFSLVVNNSSQPLIDKKNLLQWTFFNYFIGNCDAHAKNLSALISPDGYVLAPFYDLLSTIVYEDLSDKMAMKIGGENRPDWVMKRHWERLADETDVSKKAVKHTGTQMAGNLPKASNDLRKEFKHKHGPNKVIERINDYIKVSSQAFLTRMG